MIDLLLRFGVSNLCVSFLLALLAWGVQARGKRPFVAHLLWLLVLVKLITPPLMTIPVVALPGSSPASDASLVAGPSLGEAIAPPALFDSAPFSVTEPTWISTLGTLGTLETAKTALILIWVLGSACVLGWSLLRIRRFHRLLRQSAEPVSPAWQEIASRLAHRLRLETMPMILTTSAHLSPMVWWVGGRVRIVIPASLLRDLDGEEVRWILAHELAHVRRRDHLVRWLEWLACVGFWWNPVAWWARRGLRAAEETCCDALVLARLNPEPHRYANSLLNVVEFLASPALRPPAVASEINSGGFLERRLRMIVSKKPFLTTPRWLTAGILFCALGLLPLGVAYAQDHEAVGKRLREAVEAGELTPEQARIMMDALRRSSAEKEHRGPTRAEYVRAEAEMKEMVAAGKITKQQMQDRLGGMREVMAEEARGGEEGRIRREDYVRVEAELKKLVEAGMVTEEDAHRRLAEMRGALEGKGPRFTREEYIAAEARLKTLVAEGMITEADARVRLAEMRKALTAEHEGDARRFTREDYARAEAEIKKMVEAGKISEADARVRLAEMRKAIGTEHEGDARRFTREDYARAEAEIKKMVEEGKISEADARVRLAEMRKAIGAEHEGDARRFTREDYARAEAEIKKLVEAGEISKEAAGIRLGEMRRMLEEQAKHERRNADPDGDARRRRIEAAVEAGKMTREEADAMLRELRKKAAESRGRGGEAKDPRTEYAEFEAKIKEAVETGRLSREDAEKKLVQERKRLFGDH